MAASGVKQSGHVDKISHTVAPPLGPHVCAGFLCLVCGRKNTFNPQLRLYLVICCVFLHFKFSVGHGLVAFSAKRLVTWREHKSPSANTTLSLFIPPSYPPGPQLEDVSGCCDRRWGGGKRGEGGGEVHVLRKG
ncbi:hypothetical protein BaRGS_00027969 [Batillaria attramentaria]|uniref:Uncharacterized protein n=1 Tax=Batillaria attramentaria TaxID=370345 RepID=A0ABD0K1H6_9CAEN